MPAFLWYIGGGYVGWEVGAMRSQSQVIPFIGTENKLLCVHCSTQTATVYLSGQGSSLTPAVYPY